MGLRINDTSASLFALNQTKTASTNLLKAYQKLASGKRINSAADDAAGLSLAEQFRTQVAQYNTESASLQSGISAVQTADGGLQTQSDAVQRIRDLALQASNGTLTSDQRNALNDEAQQLLGQIDQTAQNTDFNGTKLLNGSQNTIDLGTGGDQVTLNSSTTNTLGINGLDLTSQAGAQNAVNSINNALNAIDQNRASLGAQQNRFEQGIQVRDINAQNSAESESRLRDLDVAQQVIDQTKNQILVQSGVAGILNANINSQTAAKLLGG